MEIAGGDFAAEGRSNTEAAATKSVFLPSPAWNLRDGSRLTREMFPRAPQARAESRGRGVRALEKNAPLVRALVEDTKARVPALVGHRRRAERCFTHVDG